MGLRMLLRGHFIGARTSAIASIACVTANAAAAIQMPADLANLSDLHTAR